jgi:hypothetical protein
MALSRSGRKSVLNSAVIGCGRSYYFLRSYMKAAAISSISVQVAFKSTFKLNWTNLEEVPATTSLVHHRSVSAYLPTKKYNYMHKKRPFTSKPPISKCEWDSY